MTFACQRDSYLKEIHTKVVSCEAGQLSVVTNDKKQKLNGYNVILEDTVLFPEGGGQPDDRGTINGVDVHRVTRVNDQQAVHFVPTPLDPGTEVEVKVDWNRRFDHMQQHSGQHLISALAKSLLGYQTTSWNLGEKTSFIELDTSTMSADQVSQLEAVLNEKIRSCIPMYPKYFDSVTDPEIEKAQSRFFPKNMKGPVRIMVIEGIDENTCCGTHVSNLSHIQAIKLLGVEKGKKNKMNLMFVAGGRLLHYLGSCYENERKITSLLKAPPDQHADLILKAQKSLKTAQKNALNLSRDLAVLEAKKFLGNPQREPLFSLHRKEGDSEFMNIIVNEIANKEVLIFLTVGDEKGSGLFLLSGRDSVVAELGPKIAEMLEGKGAGKNGRYQGKANKLARRGEAESILQHYISNST